MNGLKGKIAIVTGGTMGIGLSAAQKLSTEGCKVWICARHERENVSRDLFFHTLDVTNPASCDNLVRDVLQQDRRIDILVANAGITADSMTRKMTDEMFDSVISTNLKGIFNIVRLVGPCMEKSGGGSIITVSSIVGEYGNIGQCNYAASKGGVIAMTKSWAKEFARKGVPVRVNSVAPGYILTDMLKTVPQELLNRFASQTMIGRLGNAEEVANAIAFLASEEASYITGTVLDVNGGMRL